MLAVCALIFLPSLSFPFVSDDYIHVTNALQAGVSALNASLTQSGADRFFRPLGYWSYYVDSLWAGWSPVRWHLLDILLHLANCFLIFWVAKKMDLTAQGALIATAIFAFHGSHVEAVAWLAARLIY